MKEHRHKGEGALKLVLGWVQRPGGNETPMNQGEGVLFMGERCLKLVAQCPKQQDVIMLRHRQKQSRGDGPKPTVCEDLTEQRPANPQPLQRVHGVGRNGFSMAPTVRPELPQSSSSLEREGDFRVRIDRVHRCPNPYPERREVKPPDLPGFGKGNVRHRVLSTCDLARIQVIVIRKPCTPKNTGTSQREAMANDPSPDDGLNATGCVNLLLVDVRPERHHLTSRVDPTEGMSNEGTTQALVSGSLPPHRRTGCHCLMRFRNVV